MLAEANQPFKLSKACGKIMWPGDMDGSLQVSSYRGYKAPSWHPVNAKWNSVTSVQVCVSEKVPWTKLMQHLDQCSSATLPKLRVNGFINCFPLFSLYFAC